MLFSVLSFYKLHASSRNVRVLQIYEFLILYVPVHYAETEIKSGQQMQKFFISASREISALLRSTVSLNFK